MKKIITFTILLASQAMFSQVGIETNTPQKEIHVNGDLRVSKEIRIGGSELIKGNSGVQNQILVSNGEGLAPEWKNIEEVTIVPMLVFFSNYLNTGSYAAGSTNFVGLNTVNYSNSQYVEYNRMTDELIINQSGFYRFLIQSNNYTSGFPTAGEVRTSLLINDEILSAKSSYHHELSEEINHSLTAMEYLESGDKIKLQVYRASPYSRLSGGLSIVYSGL